MPSVCWVEGLRFSGERDKLAVVVELTRPRPLKDFAFVEKDAFRIKVADIESLLVGSFSFVELPLVLGLLVVD